MNEKREYEDRFKAPEFLAFDLLIKNNQWLIRIRFVYSIFISIFFITLKLTQRPDLVSLRDLSLVLGLMMIGNIMFNKMIPDEMGHQKDEKNNRGDPLEQPDQSA